MVEVASELAWLEMPLAEVLAAVGSDMRTVLGGGGLEVEEEGGWVAICRTFVMEL